MPKINYAEAPITEVHTARDLNERAIGQYEVTIAATRTIGGVSMDIESLDVDTYLRSNPVVMWEHGKKGNAGKPIGKTTSITRKKGEDGKTQLRAQFEFLQDDPFANEIKNAWDSGFLRSASVAFTTDAQGSSTGKRRQRMTEWSIVAVPADVQAVRNLEAMEATMADEQKNEETLRSELDTVVQTVAALTKTVEGLVANSQERSSEKTELEKLAERIEALEKKPEQQERAEPEQKTQEQQAPEPQTVERSALKTIAQAVDKNLSDAAFEEMKTRDVLVKTLGKEAPENAEAQTDDFLFGRLTAIHERRQDAAKQTMRVGGGTSDFSGIRNWTTQQLRDLNKEGA